jgi:dihydroorotate dehydrogenase
MYFLIRKLLFKLQPETAHYITLSLLKLAYNCKLLNKKKITAPKQVANIQFPNSVGLAAGLDKNGEYINALSALGFGFIEVGTVTPKPQPGNAKPRLFRLPAANALINRMGFNNKGVDFLINNIKKAQFAGILGINIGKNFNTAIENAVDDYVVCMQKVYPYASYITVNISSPNTQGLRNLQTASHLQNLLTCLKDQQATLAKRYQKYIPLFLKIAPDLKLEEIDEIAVSLLKYNIDGVIATNTTLAREGVQQLSYGNEQGGLSGQPLFNKSLLVVKRLHNTLQDKIPIIACGGIMSVREGKAFLNAGARLLQIYTGLIYQGPKLINELAGISNIVIK